MNLEDKLITDDQTGCWRLAKIAERDNKIQKYLASLLFALLSLQINAETRMWQSEINDRYKKESPELYKSVEDASNILDNYYGNLNTLKQASQLLINVLDKDEKYAPAYHQLARIVQKGGHISYGNYAPGTNNNATSLLEYAISLEPEYDLAQITLSQIFLRHKDYQNAQMLLDKAARFGAKSSLLTILQAQIYRDRDNDAARALDMLKSIRHGDYDKKSKADAAQQIAITLRKSRQWVAAEKAYYDVVTINPNNPWAHGDLSHYLLFYRKKYDAAIEEGEKALSIMDYPIGRLTTACALYSKWADALMKNKKNAESYFDRAYALYPNIDAVINKTEKYTYTKVTAEALKWKMVGKK
jgi:tetratricopeptide (TPR) repeat protein